MQTTGRKKYTDKTEYAVNIQFYKKAADIAVVGGKKTHKENMKVVRELMSSLFDKELAKK